ncbi:MAG: 4-hydroxy-tetrahydrodipicolinate reductase [Actinomycetota bacterium]
MIRVGVFGAGGRMGREVCRAVDAADDMSLVAAVDPGCATRPVAEIAEILESPVAVSDSAEAMAEAGVRVAVDFTTADSAVDNIRWCIRHGVHVVVGTTGILPRQVREIEKLLEGQGGGCNILIAPNFAIGAVLMMRFAARAAPWFPDVEIIELHHERKRDAPSGTALATVEAIAAGRGEIASEPHRDPEALEVLPGARGAQRRGVRIHSVRLPGLVAHQEVIFGGQGQTLTIRHDSLDRASFMPGVLLAIREIPRRPGLTVGLERLLD